MCPYQPLIQLEQELHLLRFIGEGLRAVALVHGAIKLSVRIPALIEIQILRLNQSLQCAGAVGEIDQDMVKTIIKIGDVHYYIACGIGNCS